MTEPKPKKPRDIHIPLDDNVTFHLREDELRQIEDGRSIGFFGALWMTMAGIASGCWASILSSPPTNPMPVRSTVLVAFATGATLVFFTILAFWIRDRKRLIGVIERIRARDTRPPGTPHGGLAEQTSQSTGGEL